MVEREASDAAGAYPITPSTQMGEYWAEEVAQGHLNISDKPLIFVEPESEHAAAGVTAGMSMTGMRAANFSSAQGLAFMHESLYAAVGKRLPYVLNLGCRAITKASLNVHCAHDDYHCADDTGFIQVMAKNAQEAADLNMIARKTAELSLTPAIVGQDGFLTTHLIDGRCCRSANWSPNIWAGRRHHRHADPRAADAVRPEAPPRAGDLGCGQSDADRRRCRTRMPTCRPWPRSVRISSTIFPR